MPTSLFDLFKIGIGPSSSHTVGPMRAAYRFAELLSANAAFLKVARLRVDLFGSLALTGRGHGTDCGILLGLLGEKPDSVAPATISTRIAAIAERGELKLFGGPSVPFCPARELLFHGDQTLPGHPNGMRFSAWDGSSAEIATRVYYSVGGGFVVEEGRSAQRDDRAPVPFPFHTAEELLQACAGNGMAIHEIVLANECVWRSEDQVRDGIEHIWNTMQECMDRGLQTEGTLPGELRVARRATALARQLERDRRADPLAGMDWLNVFAMAVNEENAAGGRVVTAPTNGAAGVIPAVARYYMRFLSGTREGIQHYFLAAAAIGALYKENASISGAEVGCQGEVGVACSMAAAALTSALGGTTEQIEHAAEIGMEHNLGLTCDPIGGLVQIPCIERNAFGAVKAVNAARLSLQDTSAHKVSLDQVIRTMYQTGLDMQSRYKETSLAGLAVNVVEC